MSVSIVTQTGVRPESADAFARWQGETSNVISTFPGFIEQRVMPPAPPLQVDWVILQRFNTLAEAQRWLGSPERAKRLEGIAAMTIGRDDVHVVQDDEGGKKPSPVSVVISTRVKSGKETEYRAWERKIAAAQSKAPGLQGYRFEPPVPNVQEDYVAILRFDSEANLNRWLESPERKKLLDEAEPLTEEFHTRMARSGFEQWFRDESGQSMGASVWKMDMIVLLLLYPIVFLWGVWVGVPLLDRMWHLPFAVNLFIGNIFSVGVTGYLVPVVAGWLGWWLAPKDNVARKNLLGAAMIVALYAISIGVFLRFF
jgi:antibiotic biosynthesis monooxygenase (ABM) superfamily enzyme